MTERVVYRQHAERMAEGESHLCQMFTKTNPELLCGNDDHLESAAVCLR